MIIQLLSLLFTFITTIQSNVLIIIKNPERFQLLWPFDLILRYLFQLDNHNCNPYIHFAHLLSSFRVSLLMIQLLRKARLATFQSHRSSPTERLTSCLPAHGLIYTFLLYDVQPHLQSKLSQFSRPVTITVVFLIFTKELIYVPNS